MIHRESQYAHVHCARFQVPAALAACALLAATTLVGTQANAAPAPKVEICHLPPGNPANFHTIKVSENAVPAHLAHGDSLGPCNALCGVLCDDGDPCTSDDTGDCEEQGCPPEPRDLKDCNDGLECTDEGECDPETGACVNLPLPGKICTPSNPSVCEFDTGVCDEDGLCEPDDKPDCCEITADCDAVDTDPCTTEVCDPDINKCVPDGGGILDCTIGACHPSVCETIAPPLDCSTECRDCCCVDLPPIPYPCCEGPADCDDGINCTDDICGSNECSHVDNCEDGYACDPNSNACELIEVPCFSMLNAPPGSTVPECYEVCEATAGCPPDVCDLKLSTTFAQDCLNGDVNACLTVDAYGRDPTQGNCQNICPLPEPEGPYLLLCGGTACARYDAGIADLANPMVRNFLDEYTYTHPVGGNTLGFNFAQAIGADGYFWAATTDAFDNWTNVWVYDPAVNELASCDAFGANTGGSCEDSALGCIDGVCGQVVSGGNWDVMSAGVATHVPGGFYAAANYGFQGSPPEGRSALVRLSPAGFTRILSNADLVAGCSGPGLSTYNLGKLEAAPLEPADPNKEEIYALLRYGDGNYNEYWIVKVDVQSGVCSEVAVLNTEAGSNAVPYLPAHAVEGGVCVPCGLQRIRVADDGTIFFLVRPLNQSQTDDGIWRLADTDGDGDYAEEPIVKIIDWEPVINEIWDFAIGPHDGNLYLLAGGPPPSVDRVTIYDPNIALGDPSLGTVFNLSAAHGAQTKMEFFPLD